MRRVIVITPEGRLVGGIEGISKRTINKMLALGWKVLPA